MQAIFFFLFYLSGGDSISASAPRDPMASAALRTTSPARHLLTRAAISSTLKTPTICYLSDDNSGREAASGNYRHALSIQHDDSPHCGFNHRLLHITQILVIEYSNYFSSCYFTDLRETDSDKQKNVKEYFCSIRIAICCQNASDQISVG